MQPGVNIEADPEPPRPPAEGSGSFASDPAVLAPLTALTATGRDPGGHVVVTLDGRGRLTDLQLDDVVVDEGRRSLERAILAASEAAADELDRLREAEAARMLEDGRLQLSALTGHLQELSDHADTRMRDALQQLRDQADRMGGQV